MPAFVILVNGRQVCSADLGIDTSLGINLSWIGGKAEPLLLFHVGGVAGDDQVRWDVPKLQVGDEVVVKIVAADGTTPPDQRKPYEGRSP